MNNLLRDLMKTKVEIEDALYNIDDRYDMEVKIEEQIVNINRTIDKLYLINKEMRMREYERIFNISIEYIFKNMGTLIENIKIVGPLKEVLNECYVDIIKNTVVDGKVDQSMFMDYLHDLLGVIDRLEVNIGDDEDTIKLNNMLLSISKKVLEKDIKSIMIK